MIWIKSIVSSISLRDLFIITLNSFILFVVTNLIFVYFSPSLIPKLPSGFVDAISSCYRPLYHFQLNSLDIESNFEIVFGDSYSEGSGDEFLSESENYGIFKKLSLNHVDRFYVIYGKGGYGSLSTLRNAIHCEPLLNYFTSLSYSQQNIERVTFIFYEGNDLFDNLVELERPHLDHRQVMSIPLEVSTLRFFLPLAEYFYKKVKSLLIKDTNSNMKTELLKIDFPTTSNGIDIPVYPQSAVLELTGAELGIAFGVLEDVLVKIMDMYPSTKLQFLYIPAVASVYHFEGALPVQSFKGQSPFISTGENSEERHIYLLGRTKSLTERIGWQFCDTSGSLKTLTSKGIPVHGPKDWKHFNYFAYNSVTESYLSCFEND